MRLLSRLGARIVIRFDRSGAKTVRGKLGRSVLRDVAAVCRAAGLERGEIWIDGRERVSFSREIPAAIHQRLRNCLVHPLR